MSAPTSFSIKLERAREHFHAFEQQAGIWLETKPYCVADEPDPDPPPEPVEYPDHTILRRWRVASVDPVPGRLSAIIGDCVFNIRSALDHLALALARKFTPGITDRNVRDSEFPIFSDASSYNKKRTQKIGCVDPVACAIIDSLQPYQRGSTFLAHPLWQIHELNRIDKHQTLTTCITSPSENGGRSFRLGMISGGGPFVMDYGVFSPGELKVDTVFLRYGIRVAGPARHEYLHPKFPHEITFSQSGPAPLQPVIPLLKGLCDFVGDDVIAQLVKFL